MRFASLGFHSVTQIIRFDLQPIALGTLHFSRLESAPKSRMFQLHDIVSYIFKLVSDIALPRTCTLHRVKKTGFFLLVPEGSGKLL